jgi:hypothetical protein
LSWKILCISNPAASSEADISFIARNVECRTTTECETIET